LAATYGALDELADAGRPAARFVVESTPDPLNDSTVGLFAALLATDTDPVRVPDAVGVNFAVIVQVAFTASDVPQVVVCEKSPVAVTPERLAAAVPEFVTVAVCVALDDPTFTLPNARLEGDTTSDGPVGGGGVPPSGGKTGVGQGPQ
jgi:hypothetical protein